MASHLPLGQVPLRRGEDWTPVSNPDELAVTVPGTIVTAERWGLQVGSSTFDQLSGVLLSSGAT